MRLLNDGPLYDTNYELLGYYDSDLNCPPSTPEEEAALSFWDFGRLITKTT